MEFEWDDEKAEINIRSHDGVGFIEAATVFEDDLALVIPDPDHSIEERRLLIIGQSSKGRLLVVSYTERGENIRIISARPAEPGERRDYENG